jgi:hypothetical protein
MNADPTSAPRPHDRKQTRHLEDLLDKALADTFPASDPVSSLATDEPVPPPEGELIDDATAADETRRTRSG